MKRIEELAKVQSIAAGKRHSAAITQSGEVYCWGFNFYDQLGIGDKSRFVEVPRKLDFGGEAVQGAQIVCGEYHTMALLH